MTPELPAQPEPTVQQVQQDRLVLKARLVQPDLRARRASRVFKEFKALTAPERLVRKDLRVFRVNRV